MCTRDQYVEERPVQDDSVPNDNAVHLPGAARVIQRGKEILLTEAAAEEIYRAKLSHHRPDTAGLASKFGVSTKAIRDVWRRRTWKSATMHLWAPEEASEYVKKNSRHEPSRTAWAVSAPTSRAPRPDCQATTPQSRMSGVGTRGIVQQGNYGRPKKKPQKEAEMMPTTQRLRQHQWSRDSAVEPRHDELAGDCNDSCKLGHLGGLCNILSDFGEWDILPVDGELEAGCLLAQACAMSSAEAAQAFPHKPVFDDVKFDDGWMMDHRMIRYFATAGGGDGKVDQTTRDLCPAACALCTSTCRVAY